MQFDFLKKVQIFWKISKNPENSFNTFPPAFDGEVIFEKI